MAEGEVTAAARAAAPLALVLAVTCVEVLRTQVVQGSATEAPGGAALLIVTALALALATTATTLTLPGARFDWRADGPVCLGLLVALVGAVVAGWQGGPDHLRSAGAVVAPLTVPLLLALVERRARGTMRWSALATIAVSILSLTRYAVRDPFRDPDCWADCSLREVAPLASAEAARVVELVLGVTTSVAAALALGWTVHLAVRLARRRAGGPQLVLAVAAGASVAAVLWAVTALVPDRAAASRLAAAATAMQCGTALLVAAPPMLAVRRRRELRRLAAALGEQPPLGTLEVTLSRMLGDRDLKVAYWLPRSARFVDAAGRPFDAPDRPSITLLRDGQPLAQVFVHRTDGELEELVGPAARLAIDSERLQAEVRAQLTELLAARQRIVAAGDDARRHVERTIHDEVQSELVGALLELAHIRSQAESAGDAKAVREAEEMTTEIRGVVDALREFARGVYPAVLDASGLPDALEALADEVPVTVRIECRGDGSASTAAQRAAYLLVHDATTRTTRPMGVTVDASPERVELTITGHPGAVPMDVTDRVGALGGTLTSEWDTLRAVLPCA